MKRCSLKETKILSQEYKNIKEEEGIKEYIYKVKIKYFQNFHFERRIKFQKNFSIEVKFHEWIS